MLAWKTFFLTGYPHEIRHKLIFKATMRSSSLNKKKKSNKNGTISRGEGNKRTAEILIQVCDSSKNN